MEENKEILPVISEQKSNDLSTVDTTRKELIQEILNTESPDELEKLYQKFDLNNTKKNIVRLDQLNELLDSVNNQAKERFEKRPDEISNKELLDYMTAVQNQIDRAQKTVDNIKDIKVQVNNTQTNNININVESDDLSLINRTSRDKITSLISQILNSKDDIIDIDEIKEIDKGDSND